MHLAHVNVARARGPLISPVMAGFMEGVAAMNRLAEASPGFVWRLLDDEPAPKIFGDPRLVVNVSVWETADALRAYTYHTAHGDFLRRRREWFERPDGPHLALWWIEPGTRPTLTEARDRLRHLAAHGPTPTAFTFADLPAFAPADPPDA